MQIKLDIKKLARQVRGLDKVDRPLKYMPDAATLPKIEHKDGLYTVRDFNFCVPRLWSSGKASKEQIIIHVLSEPNMHDFTIIKHYFGSDKLLSVWDENIGFFAGKDYAFKYLAPVFEGIRARLGM